MSSFNSGLNPNVVKTELDDIFYQTWDYIAKAPGYADEETSNIFIQDTDDKSAVQEEVMMDVTYWDEKSEEEDSKNDSPLITNKITTTHATYSKDVEIPKEFFDDNMHAAYEKMVKGYSRKAKLTKTRKAMEIYRGAFDTTTTADAAYFISDSHTTISGDTVDNKGTAALTPDSLDAGIVNLLEQKDQRGDVSGSVAKTLLVPPKLFRVACQIAEAEWEYGTTDNNKEMFSSKYGIAVYQSNYLGANAGGSDTAWFLLGDNHDVRRYVREGLSTQLLDWRYSKNHRYIYKGRYRESYRVIDYVGVYGSTGTA